MLVKLGTDMNIKVFLALLSLLQIYSCNASAIENKTYKETFFEHTDNASDKWENYFDIYQPYLEQHIGKNASILEIGVLNGGHLQILKKYLSNADIYGIDVIDDICKLDLGNGIKTFCFDATKQKLINQNLKQLTFDIVIDDASHESQDVIATFELMFSRVKPGGVYIIEDLHASYWKEFKGGYKAKHSQIEYLKALVDLLNAYHVKKNDTYNLADHEFYNSLSVKDKELFKWISSITFHDSIVVITKLKNPRTVPYERVVVGTKQPIHPTIDAAKAGGYYRNPSK